MNQKTVLIIEDEALNMKLAREILKIGGYKTLEAVDAETGIILAKEYKPDLILMDMQLPGMSGLDAMKIISQDNELKVIPIAVCTAFAMSINEGEARSAGCVAFITKPYSVKDFLETINNILKPHSINGEE